MKRNCFIKRITLLLLAFTMLLGCFAGCAEVQSPDDDAATTVPSSSSGDEVNKIEIDPQAQEAVVKTAIAYLARGTRIQYDDSEMYLSAPGNAGKLYRWEHSVRLSPEEYTSQYVGYTNCAAFTHDVYLAALDLDIGAYTTAALSGISGEQCAYKYKPTGKETADEMAAMEEEFRSNLIAGDIIVIRYNGSKAGGGHAMLYVGGEVLEKVDGYKGTAAEGTNEDGTPKDEGFVYDIIHSTGSSYRYNNGEEKYEQYGSIQKMSVDSLFDSENSRYVFAKLQSIAIVRPLAAFQGDIPQHTVNRMQYMDNVMAEKLSSHIASMTVNPGETMTFTFSITNKNEQEVTLPVTDVLPANTTFVSSENCTVDGANLSWTVTVPAGTTQTVSYTVRVNEDAKPGDYVDSTEGSVGGIAVNCPRVYIGRTLTQDEQKALLAATQTLAGSELRGLELANALYTKALGNQELLPNDYTTLVDGIFTKESSYSYLAAEGTYQNLVVPGLFGGRFMIQRKSGDEDQLARHEELRTRLLTEEQLMAGDIIIVDVDVQYKVQAYYLYTGEALLDLLSGEMLAEDVGTQTLTECLKYTRFAVLRPSLGMDSSN